MILPNKHLRPDRSLLGIGADILQMLDHDRTVSELWERLQAKSDEAADQVTFNWFVLALTFLYAIGAIDFARGVIIRRSPDDT